MPTVYTTNAISGNPVRKKGATILNAGNVDGKNVTNNLTLATNAFKVPYGSRPFLAVSPGSSGNVGTKAALSSGQFGKMTKGKYLIYGLNRSDTIAGLTTITVLTYPGHPPLYRPRGFINASAGSRLLNITSWNAVTGAATKGVSAGNLTTFGQDKQTISDAIPGQLVYMPGSKTPYQDNYKAKTNT